MSVDIRIGDCRERLRDVPDCSVNMCVTSPPYFGLRDYGVDGQMGLEPTPDEFVAGMVEVFREVRRVLRDDGTLWLNIGDSYNAQPGQRKATDKAGAKQVSNDGSVGIGSRSVEGCKPKDLIGIPWMLAFALRADGWYLRQDIIWSKPNPMPESVRDRCTKAHEYLFLLSKGSRYFYDAEAIKEGMVSGPPGNRSHRGATAYQDGDEKHRTKTGLAAYGERQRRRRGLPPRHTQYQDSSDQSGLDCVGRGEGRNKRSVWTVATQPFSEAHFATFPPSLIEPCILAGCPAGGTVLDPFFGAGTTGLVADRLQRNCIGIELNPEYAELARRRLGKDRGGLLNAMEAA